MRGWGRHGWSECAAAVLVSLLTLVSACSSGRDDGSGVLSSGERMPDGLSLTSSAFEEEGDVPERFSCEGENVPPPLRWEGVPDDSRELALVIEDPDAPDGIFVHWLVVGIDPGITGIDPSGPPPGAQVLPGSSDNPTYIGPCPPDGDGPHRYVFQIYALPQSPRLAGDSTPVEKVRAIRDAATAGGVLVATFER